MNYLFLVLMFSTIGFLTACMMPIEEATETSAKIGAETSDKDKDTPEILESATEQETTPEEVDCFTANCIPGRKGDQFCTSICGDVAKCFAEGAGCGTQPCCVPL